MICICGKPTGKFSSNYFSPERTYCSTKCQRKAYYLRNRNRLLSLSREYHNKNKKSKSDYFHRWYEKNKEHQKLNSLLSYQNKKEKWFHRNFVNRNRIIILNILSKNCVNCNKNQVEVIHHKEYRNELRYKKFLEEYCKYLLPFCSRRCHREFEAKV